MSREIHSSGKVLRLSVFVNKRLEQDQLIRLSGLPVAVNDGGEIAHQTQASKVLHVCFAHDDKNEDTGHTIYIPGGMSVKLHNSGETGQLGGPREIYLKTDAKGTYVVSKLVRVLFQMVVPPQKWVDEEPGAEDTVEDLYETLI